MRRIKKERVEFDPGNFKKGKLLVVKVPPFYDREYLYEVSGAGGAIVRANLYHSPRVKKQWSIDDLELLFDSGMIRFAEEADRERLLKSGESSLNLRLNLQQNLLMKVLMNEPIPMNEPVKLPLWIG